MKTTNNWSCILEAETRYGNVLYFVRNGEYRSLWDYSDRRGGRYKTSIIDTDETYLFTSNNETSACKLEDARNSSKFVTEHEIINAGHPSFFEKIRRRRLLRQYK